MKAWNTRVETSLLVRPSWICLLFDSLMVYAWLEWLLLLVIHWWSGNPLQCDVSVNGRWLWKQGGVPKYYHREPKEVWTRRYLAHVEGIITNVNLQLWRRVHDTQILHSSKLLLVVSWLSMRQDVNQGRDTFLWWSDDPKHHQPSLHQNTLWGTEKRSPIGNRVHVEVLLWHNKGSFWQLEDEALVAVVKTERCSWQHKQCPTTKE